jgi:hypothetical protein
MKNRPPAASVLTLVLAVSCGGSQPAPSSAVDAKLVEVARIHGGAGPWAVAGYRMGEHALRALGLDHGSVDLEIVHYTPHEVQYSCIALTLADVPAAETHTIYRRKSTGQSIALRVTASFAARFANVAPERLGEAGRQVMQLRDDEIFEVLP